MWRRLGLIALLASAASGLLLASCSMPRSLKTALFENVPPPGEERPPAPVVGRPRHPPLKSPPKPPPVVVVPEKPAKPDWAALYAKLPRDEQGEVNWVRALDEKRISPKPGLAPDAEGWEPLDLDLEFVPEGMPDFKVVFPHKPHTQWLGCANCHAGLFEMEKGKAAMSMEKLNEGAYCGLCHGKVAAPDLNTCKRCHVAMPG
jgi:c(7)-type cytochrome triheme protein